MATPALRGGEPANLQPSADGTGPMTQRILLEYFLDRQSGSRGFHQSRRIGVIIVAKRPKPVTIDQEPDMFGRFMNTPGKAHPVHAMALKPARLMPGPRSCISNRPKRGSISRGSMRPWYALNTASRIAKLFGSSALA